MIISVTHRTNKYGTSDVINAKGMEMDTKKLVRKSHELSGMHPGVTCLVCDDRLTDVGGKLALLREFYFCGNASKTELGHQMMHTSYGPTALCILKSR